MTAERFFELVRRFNTIGIAFALVVLAVISVTEYWRASHVMQFPYAENQPYGEAAKAIEDSFEGEEIEIAGGVVVKYQIAGDPVEGKDVSGENISLTNMQTGKSITVLPEGSDQMILNWEVVQSAAEDAAAEPTGFYAITGTEEDYDSAYLDLTVGDLRDLDTRTLFKRIRFVDAVRMIGPETMSMIVWDTLDSARFIMVDMDTLEITLERPVTLPAKPE